MDCGLWHGYKLVKEEFLGKELYIACPDEKKCDGKWVLKTEYREAFPNTELKLLEKGYHVVHLKNRSRWYPEDDVLDHAALCRYMHEEKGLSEKCVIVGMSCGGCQGVIFAAQYPQYVSCMYLDAPVIDFLSVVAGFGNRKNNGNMMTEFSNAMGIDKIGLLSYRKHPLDYIPKLVKSRIPVVLVAGDSDKVVVYEENGKLLYDAYVDAGIEIQLHMKKGCDHHPHGLEDPTPVVQFIMKHDK